MTNEYGQVIENANLKNYNTYKIDTNCKYLILPETIDKLINLINYLNNNNMSYMILGNGSNVILPDNYYNGTIICLKKLDSININDDVIEADAGVMLPKLVLEAVNNNLKGLEWAYGRPGILGGSVYGNGGAYLSKIMEFIISVKVLDKSGNIKELRKDEIKYDYRTTSFKEDNNKEYIILSAKLQLEHGNKEESMNKIEDRKQRRLASQPLNYPSAGSVFRNPSKELPAGKIIEDANFKGYRIGGAEVSEKHANFIINVDNAKASDIKSIIKEIKDKIKEINDIELKCEQEIIEWD